MSLSDENLRQKLRKMTDEDIRELIPRLAPGERVQIAKDELDKRQRQRDVENQAHSKSLDELNLKLKQDANRIAMDALKNAQEANWIAKISLGVAFGALGLSILIAIF